MDTPLNETTTNPTNEIIERGQLLAELLVRALLLLPFDEPCRGRGREFVLKVARDRHCVGRVHVDDPLVALDETIDEGDDELEDTEEATGTEGDDTEPEEEFVDETEH